MKIMLILLSFSLSGLASAEEVIWAETLTWLQTNLPEQSQLGFSENTIKFDGCRQREYRLTLDQVLSKKLHVESVIGYEKGELTWGAHKQKISMREWSIVPRYQFNRLFDIGFGVVRSMAAQFETTDGADLQLPKSIQWLLSSRTAGLDDNHFFEVTISSQQWQSTNPNGNWLERGYVDKKLILAYTGQF